VSLPNPPLLVITDRRQARRPLEDVAAQCFAGGCRWLSLREKDLPAAERRALLRCLVALARPYGARVGVHEDVEAALAAGAGALHLPEGGSPRAVRMRLPAGTLIGLSVHDGAGLRRAAEERADYVTLSPVFVSASKPEYGPALGVENFSRLAKAASVPVLALGGIADERITGMIEAGAAGVAVMGAAMAADDPAHAVAGLVARLGAALAARRGGGHIP
jgi:thiamine-phosphate pyrophosphorylase